MITEPIDLIDLAARESEQIEWKENVADIDDVVATLSAFANDLSNLGGGYVICGAAEVTDPNGFPAIRRAGLSAARLKEVEGTVLSRCRERVFPSITPRVQELAGEDPDRRILVFIQPSTPFAHLFRAKADEGRHFVRVGRSTIQARNGVLRNLLVRKGDLEPWDRRACASATVDDVDLLALRDALQRMRMSSGERGVEPYLSTDIQIHALVPPLCVREALTGTLRPRNFTMLLFGREVQRFVPGASSVFSIYPGLDRSDAHAERHELAGTLIDQARRLRELLDVQSYTAFDKNESRMPNAVKYPTRALYEAVGNALAHRDYELADPTRVTVFEDRIEVVSPGSLPYGVDSQAFREGRSGPKWRNQTLAWFFSRLQIAQAEGQGIPTILRSMREEGCPPPRLDADDIRVTCVLPAHPRFALLREFKDVEQAVALGQLEEAEGRINGLLVRDPLNVRTIQLFAEIEIARRDPEAVARVLERLGEDVFRLPAGVLVLLSEALNTEHTAPNRYRAVSNRLLMAASQGRLEERELRRIGVALLRNREAETVLSLIERLTRERPELIDSASVLQLKGDALLGLANKCKRMATRPKIAKPTRDRSWREFDNYLAQAEKALLAAQTASLDIGLDKIIARNLDYLSRLKSEASHPGRRS